MEIWKNFKKHLQEKFYGGNIFTCMGTMPKTKDEIYWYNKALQDCVLDVKQYEKICESKYNSLLNALSKKGILVAYDEYTNIHILHNSHENLI